MDRGHKSRRGRFRFGVDITDFLQNHVNEAENHRTNTATVKTARVEMAIDQSFNQFGNSFT